MTADTGIIPRTVVTEIVGHRNAALAMMREAVDGMARSLEQAREAQRVAGAAHAGAAFTMSDRSSMASYQRIFEEIDPDVSIDTYRKQLDAQVWMHLLDRTGMSTMMDRTAKDELYRDLCGEVPEVTEETIYATLEGLAGDAKLIFQRGLARAFIDLDPRFRSHDAFRLGSRIILTNAFDAYGMWNHYSRTQATICDLERVFMVLDGNPDGARIGELTAKIGEDRGGGLDPRRSTTESTYFRVHTYKNGNAHLWFTRDDLVQKANEQLAEFYGAVLPDAVPDDVSGDAVRSYALSKDLAFYQTPTELARKLVHDLGLDGARVLEPSAGRGRLVFECLARGAHVHAIEVHPSRADDLRRLSRTPVGRGRLEVQEANFLRVAPGPTFDAVVMNPPFSGTHWMAHVRHAFDFLKPGGSLIAILPSTAELGTSKKHVAFREWASQHARYRGLRFDHHPLASFAESGTRVSTCTLQLHRRKVTP